LHVKQGEVHDGSLVWIDETEFTCRLLEAIVVLVVVAGAD